MATNDINKVKDDILATLSSGGWVKGPNLARKCGVTERTIRHTAESTGLLIGGNNGYKRVDMATQEEINHAVASLRSRADKLTARADAIMEIDNGNK
jgi:hypothetical protein